MRPRLFWAVLLLVACAATAGAHGLRTAYLEVSEIEPGRATVHLRLSAPDPALTIEAQEGCSASPAGDAGSAYDRTWLLECPGGLGGRTLGLRGLGPIIGDAVAWMSYADGTTASQIVRPAAPRLVLRQAGGPVVRQYVRLGIGHILSGYDHLLFLLLLVLLLRDVRGVLLAETAFTLSHSLSFSATALGWLRVPSAPAEACIALSLVLLAADVRSRGPAASRWRGALMALVFGLVHGLGFAGGLREIGLPERAVGAALLSFGAGIEIGQVAFLALVLLVRHAMRNVALLPRLELGAVYATGGLSAYWVLERSLACFGS